MELMVVIAIIGLLTGIIALRLVSVGDRGRRARAQADLDVLRTAVMLYRMEQGRFPADLAELRKPTKDHPAGFIESLPKDPWQNDYVYEKTQHTATLRSYGADGQRGGEYENADISIPPEEMH